MIHKAKFDPNPLTLDTPVRKHSAGFTLVEVAITTTIIALVAISAIGAMSTLNRNAAANRNLVSAETIVRDRIEQASRAMYAKGATPADDSIDAILQETPHGTDENGDGEGDGVVFESNVTILGKRDSKVGNAQVPVISGTLYRRCHVVNADLGLRQVSFLITYTFRGRTYSYGMATFRTYSN
jgi:type II secretory pathway pseudopilin PulG